MPPVSVKREDLLILWTVREDADDETMLQVRGRVYYKDDKIREKPRMLGEVHVPKDMVANHTMEQLIEMAEERLELDVHEIAGTGPYAPDGPHKGVVHEGIEVLRKAMAK